jgi:hypothetical protein
MATWQRRESPSPSRSPPRPPRSWPCSCARRSRLRWQEPPGAGRGSPAWRSPASSRKSGMRRRRGTCAGVMDLMPGVGAGRWRYWLDCFLAETLPEEPIPQVDFCAAGYEDKGRTEGGKMLMRCVEMISRSDSYGDSPGGVDRLAGVGVARLRREAAPERQDAGGAVPARGLLPHPAARGARGLPRGGCSPSTRAAARIGWAFTRHPCPS